MQLSECNDLLLQIHYSNGRRAVMHESNYLAWPEAQLGKELHMSRVGVARIVNPIVFIYNPRILTPVSKLFSYEEEKD